MHPAAPPPLRRRAIAAALAMTATHALALPQGEQVSAGQGSFARSGTTLTVTQQSPNMAINWQRFGIAAGESVVFAQPNASAIALNRVLGLDPSQIDGRLTANGQVWLLNPSGVIFGNGAQVNVGGLVASTLNLSDADFLAGRRTFSGNAGLVINQGAIATSEGGYVALIGGRVINEGLILARLGTVAMAAGRQVTLDFAGDRLLGIQVDQGVVESLVQNRQLVQADGGQVVMTSRAAETVMGSVVNNEGVVEARTIDTRTGVIRLLGSNDGGTVQQTGTLDASAPAGGDGGRIETSAGQVNVADTARISTEAPFGTTGTWVVDPADFTIAATNGDITGSALANRLASNNIVLFSQIGKGEGAGDLRVFDSVSWNSPNRLTLSAERHVTVAAPITNAGSGGVTLSADNLGACGAGAADCGTVRFTGAGRVSVNGGDVDIYYNPPGSNRAADVNGNGPNYATPVDFSRFVMLGGDSRLNAWMLVNDAAQLQAIATNPGGDYALGRDIDAAATAGWNGGAGFVPIPLFTGRFDGLDGVIGNLAINRPAEDFTGLFRIVGPAGSVANLHLTEARIAGRNNVGALAGENQGSVENVTSTAAQVSGAQAVGGLVGRNPGSIDFSDADSTVTGQTDVGGLAGQNLNLITASSAGGTVSGLLSGPGQIGGLVGNNGGIVSDSLAVAAVNGPSRVGGLAGINSGTISLAAAGGTLSGEGATGGLVGYNTAGATIAASRSDARVNGGSGTDFGGFAGINNGDIETSFATGAVDGASRVGGLAGSNNGNIRDSFATGAASGNTYVGGLVGYNAGSVATSYSAGAVSGDAYVGGLLGSSANGSIASYWDVQRSGTTTGVALGNAAGVTGLNPVEMRRQASFSGFDFTNTWNIVEGLTYPFLDLR